MVFGVGSEELLIILVVIVILFGPKKLPELARNLGKAMAEFNRAKDELIRGVESEPGAKPLPEGVKEIAKNLGIDAAGKGEEELLREIAERTKSKPAGT
ncbi:MAG: twin-arginine translocase TatA/TatE family subunit [Candidatus Hydrothermarchaeota archaeon]